MGKPALDIGRLTAEERLELIEDLWESLGDERDNIPLTAEQREELDRRLDALDDAEPEGLSPDQMRQRASLRHRPRTR